MPHEHRPLPYTIVSLSAGLREPSSSRRLADRLTEAAVGELAAAGHGTRVRAVEIRDHAHDAVDALLTGRTGAGLAAALRTVADADLLIAVTPVFGASCSGLFKTFVDVLDHKSLAGRPVVLGATGGSPRHQLVLDHALRPLFAHLRADVVPTAVFAAPEDWGAGEARLTDRIGRAALEAVSRLRDHPDR